MYKVSIDESKNLMLLQLENFMMDHEMEVAGKEVLECAKRLKPGMIIINDIARMKPASQNGAEIIKNVQAEVMKIGVKKVIRVVEHQISKMQFDRTTKQAGASYEIIEVSTLEEAMKLV